MKNIKAVGFDLFNTLVTMDSSTLSEAETRLVSYLKSAGLAIDGESFIDSHKRWARRFIDATRKDGRETHNRFWISAALRDAGLNLEPEDPIVACAVEVFFSSFVDHCRVIPGTVEMLRSLSSDFAVGLLSNFTHGPAARKILAAAGLDQCFSAVVISGEVGFRKPHHLIFDRLVSEMGAAHHETVYVGDDPEPDIVGALGVGIRPVLTTYVRDRGLNFAPGYISHGPDEDHGAQSISNWDELIRLLASV